MQDRPFDSDIEKFSTVKRCPMCGKLSLHSINGKIICESCGFTQDTMRIK